MTKIFLYPGDRNDATIYYLEIIADALRLNGERVEFVEEVKDINKCDKILSIIPKSFWSIIRRRIKGEIIYWFQGIVPEEISYYNYSIVKRFVHKIAYTLVEYLILKKSTFNFFVSNTMVNHYQKKYGYKKENYFVMPCFNQPLLKEAFVDTKYEQPTFVYTGNLAKWQCFEPMVVLFSKIKQQIPSASLTIYTKDKENAKVILNKYHVEAEIKYVPYNQLAQEIKKFKYGFILREDNVVNNVATPTKMNSYLASGIIPIYTDVIGAYKENLSGLEYAIPLTVGNQGLEKLLVLENKKLKASDILHEYTTVFTKYYNRDYYVKAIAERLKKRTDNADIYNIRR